MVERRQLDITSITETITVGRCIYCGTSDGKLTREHIIPLGLGGRLVLSEASCDNCQKVTKAFEQNLLRGQFYNYRDSTGLPTRRKKERREELPLIIRNENEEDGLTTLFIEPGKYPRYVVLHIFPEPGILIDRDITEPVKKTIGVFGVKDDFENYDKIRLNEKLFDISFCQLLAKIGWGYAIACLGWDELQKHKVLILDTIMSPNPYARHLIGCEPGDHKSTKGQLHELSLYIVEKLPKKYLVARVRLFSDRGTHPYLIVLAEISL